MVPPSGRQFSLRHGDQRTVLVEVGGGIREYSVGDRVVLDGYPVGEMADGGRGQPLLPWPNRIRDGRYHFNGSDLQLPINEAEHSNAIHGLTRWSNWTATEVSDKRVTLMLLVYPQPGYPFSLLLAIEYELGGDGLTVTTRAVNVGTEPLPFGAGYHPYLAPAGSLDETELLVPAARRLQFDERQLPTGALADVAGTAYDFRSPRALGDLRIDACFTGLDREGGTARVRAGRTTLWMDSSFTHLMVFTGDTLAPERRRRGLAVEPMTCPPDAFNSGKDVHVLQPRESFVARWGISP